MTEDRSPTRQEHLKWCKDRAINEMNFYKDPAKGIISLMSDLRKHPETNKPVLQTLCMAQLLKGQRLTYQEVINFIDGFN